MRMNRNVAFCLALAPLLSLACSSSQALTPAAPAGADAGGDDAASGPSDDGGPDAADAGVQPPSTPAGDALSWVLSALNGARITSADVSAHVTTGFIQSVPAPQLITIFQQMAQKKPWTLVGFDGKTTTDALTAIVTRADGQYWRIQINVAPATPKLIEGLFLDPAPDLDPTLATWGALDAKLQGAAPVVRELAATIDTNGCTQTHTLAGDQNGALGSQFKLWILATLAQSIDTGAHAWTDLITIQDQYKSLPSGTFQNQPNGTQLSAKAFAEAMISESDNTAADHLLFFVGRTQVEGMLTTTKHHDPTEDQPFLSTREMFDLKLMLTPQERATYESDSIANKRTLLAQYDTTLDPRNYVGSWTSPIDVDKLEWFASPTDLCNVMAALKAYGDKTGTSEVYHALSINPGIPDDANLFAYVGFKGGSEPGVLTMSWLLRRASDQGWRYYGVELNDTQNLINEDLAIYLAGAGRTLVGR
jgi:hypothetical protein